MHIFTSFSQGKRVPLAGGQKNARRVPLPASFPLWLDTRCCVRVGTRLCPNGTSVKRFS